MEQDFSGTPGQPGGSEVKEQAKEQTQQLAQQARQQAGELANRGTEQVKSQLANQKHEASQRMAPIQTALRETGQQLRKQGQGSVGQYADKAADQLERFSGYLRETDVDEIADEARGFARHRPAIFLGGAVALGFLATRFLKSSSQEASNGSSMSSNATSGPTVPYGTEEPATALPPDSVEGSRRTPLAEQPPRGA